MIRDARPSDAPSIAKLLRSLGYNTTEKELASKLTEYAHRDDYRIMIDAEEEAEGEIVHGVIGLHSIALFHSKGKIGRILSLIFDESYRGNRAGKVLLEAADEYFINSGCQYCEVVGAVSASGARKLFKNLAYLEGERYLQKTYKLAKGP